MQNQFASSMVVKYLHRNALSEESQTTETAATDTRCPAVISAGVSLMLGQRYCMNNEHANLLLNAETQQAVLVQVQTHLCLDESEVTAIPYDCCMLVEPDPQL